ncbi:TNF receptor-associated factor 1-like [Halichondria panicea]|uniref:TNF receptor-associated factor 1-like n=1 Tax=Halichondria panicea TaxID=6063 RepID=UPI00312B572C
MPGHKVFRSTSKNPALFDKYQCPYCNHLLKDAVQPICGHWLCECCADELLAESSPKCPKVDCQEYHKGNECFPDRFVRRDVKQMIVSCPRGCQWEDMVAELEAHLKACNFISNLCGVVLTPDQIGTHTHTVTLGEPVQHFNIHGSDHGNLRSAWQDPSVDCQDKECLCVEENAHLAVDPKEATSPHPIHTEMGVQEMGVLQKLGGTKLAGELTREFMRDMKQKNEEISLLKSRLAKLETQKEIFLWKITGFSEKIGETQLGTAIFSLPFYSGQYGYKMCLKLYFIGDGVRNTISHLSLFFLIMKGEFDNILSWPFTSKVIFKLINQTGNRDIIDTFQPDPTRSSFQKPRSDMNIASGCPRFVSHTELKSGGFIVEDTVFIKCSIE